MGSFLFQNQFLLNPQKDQYDLVQVPSLPLGFVVMAVSEWRMRLNDYFEDAIENHFQSFPVLRLYSPVERSILLSIFDYYNTAADKRVRLSLLFELPIGRVRRLMGTIYRRRFWFTTV